MAIQDECKHENQAGTFCGLCGKPLKDPQDVEMENFIDGAMERVLTKHGVIKPKPAGAPPSKKENLADRLIGKKKTK